MWMNGICLQIRFCLNFRVKFEEYIVDLRRHKEKIEERYIQTDENLKGLSKMRYCKFYFIFKTRAVRLSERLQKRTMLWVYWRSNFEM